MNISAKKLRIFLQESEGGLYVSLSSFLGLSRQFLEMHYQKTKESFYLLIKKTKRVCVWSIN